MARPRVTFFLCLCMALSGIALAADAAKVDGPSRFLPNVDRQLIRITNPIDGTTWAAWTYTNGSESDIAISRLDVDGIWSQPQLIGLNDHESQGDPALAVDGYGTTYLAYAERGTGRVFVTALGLDARDWTTPSAVTPPGLGAGSPAVMIAANRVLVVGYITSGRVSLREFPLLPPVILGNGNDGPDPLGHHAWPPESQDDENDDGVIGGESLLLDLEFTGPVRRGRGRQ